MKTTSRHKLNRNGRTDITLPLGAKPLGVGYIKKELYLTALEDLGTKEKERRTFVVKEIGEQTSLPLGGDLFPHIGGTSYTGVNVFEDVAARKRVKEFSLLGIDKREPESGKIKISDLVSIVSTPVPQSDFFKSAYERAKKDLLFWVDELTVGSIHGPLHYDPATGHIRGNIVFEGNADQLAPIKAPKSFMFNWDAADGPDVSATIHGIVTGKEEKRIREAVQAEFDKAPIPANKEGRDRIEKAVLSALKEPTMDEVIKASQDEIAAFLQVPKHKLWPDFYGAQAEKDIEAFLRTTLNCRCVVRTVDESSALLSAAQKAIRNLKNVYTEGLKNPTLTGTQLGDIYGVIQCLHETVSAEKIKAKGASVTAHKSKGGTFADKVAHADKSFPVGATSAVDPNWKPEEPIKVGIGQIWNGRKHSNVPTGEYRISGFRVDPKGLHVSLDDGQGNRITVAGKDTLHQNFTFNRESVDAPVGNPSAEPWSEPAKMAEPYMKVGQRWRGKSTGNVYKITDFPVEQVEVQSASGGKTFYHRSEFKAFFEPLTPAEALQLDSVEFNRRFDLFIRNNSHNLIPWHRNELARFAAEHKELTDAYAQAKVDGQ